MTSNQDILAFLKAGQEASEKEKAEEKETRARERKEDRENILEMIRIGIQKEVKIVIKDVEDRLLQQEKHNQELTKQLNSVLKDMELMKTAVRDQEVYPALPVPRGAVSMSGGPEKICRNMEEVTGELMTGNKDDFNKRAEDICDLGRRIVGFKPIEQKNDRYANEELWSKEH